MSKSPYLSTGTTSLQFVRRGRGGQVVQPGKDYFLVRVHSAQAAFYGSLWQKNAQLIVASQVNLNHPILGKEPLYALRLTRPVERQEAVQLGLRSNLINLAPASMDRVTISIDFILDAKNRLHDLTGLINDENFLTAISLAPGAALAARAVAGLAQKIVATFLPAEERTPILQFAGDFNLPTDDLKDGYHVLLASSDDRNPLPRPLPELTVDGSDLLADGKPVTQWSYIILDVRRAEARTRDLHEGAAWDARLSEAEDEADQALNDPLAGDSERQSAWEKCRSLLMEARALLRNDPNYLRAEAETIVKASYDRCVKVLEVKGVTRGGIIKAARGSWQPDLEQDRSLLGIPPDEDLTATLDVYAEQAAATRRMMRELGTM